MTTIPLVLLPDPILREVSKPVTQFDAALKRFGDNMLDTMYGAPGIGLAAIQVAEPIRMLVIDLAKDDQPKDPTFFINPEIVEMGEDDSIYEEGCLSIPDYYAEVQRPASVKVTYQDLSGKSHELEADGLLATCLQHEIDHLNGILFVDHLSRLKRDIVVKKFRKMAKERGTTRLEV